MLRSRRIGVFGGAFSPIHLGHLLAARAVKEALDLDEVRFLPTGHPAFPKTGLWPAAQRLRQLKAALKGEPGFVVDSRELRRKGTSYAVDTLEQLKAELGEGTQLFFLIGLDAALHLPKWKAPERLPSLARFCVMTRPGVELDQARWRSLKKRFSLKVVHIPEIDISSSEIRKRMAQGKSVRWMVP